MSKKFALEQSSWNCGTVELYKGPLLAHAAIMNGAHNQFLSRTGFSQKQYSGVAGSHGFHEIQNAVESRTLSHNSFEVHLPANFLFQVQLFLSELVFQFGDLAIGQRILHRDSHLSRRSYQEIEVFRAE